jgi:hypothetical protein
MTIETEIALLTTSTTNLTTAVVAQQTSVDEVITDFAATTTKVTTELNLVDNTADADKPISTDTQTALDTKQPTLVSGDNISTINGESILSGSPLVIARGQVEIPLLQYEDRANLRTPVAPEPSTGDVVNIPNLGQLQYTSSFDYFDDDETVFEVVSSSDGVTPIGQWYLAIPAYEWVESQKMFENALLWEWMEDESTRHSTF